MGFFQKNKMSRNNGVKDTLSRLRMRHNAIIERKKKDRVALTAKKVTQPVAANKASTLADPSTPTNDVSRNSVMELDSVCHKSPSKNNLQMASVAEWLLWGDEDSISEPPARLNVTRRAQSESPARSITPSTPDRSTRRESRDLSSTPTISESHSFDHSQLDSHFYSEYTDDYTLDSMADVTLASSKEPGLFTHGLMAVGELFTRTPATPSPDRRRRPAPSRSEYQPRKSLLTDEESDEDESAVYSTYTKDDEDTVTTASSSPSNGENNHNWMGRRSTTPVKYHNMTNVNIIDSSEMEVEMSLETVTRIEI